MGDNEVHEAERRTAADGATSETRNTLAELMKDPKCLLDPGLLVRERLRAAFAETVVMLGEAEARRTWAQIPPVRRRGAPKGPRNPKKTEELLELYLAMLSEGGPEDHPGQWPRIISEYLHEIRPKIYGSSPDAIAKRLRRLIADKKSRKY